MKIEMVELKLIKKGFVELDIEDEIRHPGDIVKAVKQLIADKDREYLIVFLLNTKNKVNAVQVNSIGSLNSALVHPREVFKSAVMANAASIIIAHNHPSGDTYPSGEDVSITKRLYECSKILGIELLDHIIVGFDSNDYYSFKREEIIL